MGDVRSAAETREKYLEKEVVRIAEWLLETKKTIRDAAVEFKVSKSCIHRRMQKILKHVDGDLYKQVQALFNANVVQGRVLGGSRMKGVQKGLKRRERDGSAN